MEFTGIEIENRPGIYIPLLEAAKDVLIIVLPNKKVYYNHRLKYMEEAVDTWFRAILKYQEAIEC